MIKNTPICLFDSGIGGLTVVKKLLKRFPNESYIYLADLARVPYGDRTKEEIKSFVNEIIEWLSKFDPKLIIMACNTSSAINNQGETGLMASQQQLILNSQFSILNFPIYGMIESCAKEISKSNYKKVSVWATKLVVESNSYKKSIHKYNPNIIVEEIACPKLVPMIEDLSFTISERNKIISEYLNETSKDTEALILGCTHYPLISEDITPLSKLQTIDPTDSLIKELEQKITTSSSSVITPNISLYATAQIEKVKRFSKLYLGNDFETILVELSKASV